MKLESWGIPSVPVATAEFRTAARAQAAYLGRADLEAIYVAHPIQDQTRGEIEARIIRPAALIDWTRIELPGLIGRRLFDRWHLGLGRPGLPFAVCDVSAAAAAVAWCADRFGEAPSVINLMDPDIRTRGDLLEKCREHGWRGRMLWTPISFLAGALMAARFGMGVVQRKRPEPMAVWSILRPRRYDTAVSSKVFASLREHTPAAEPARARAYG